MSLSPNSAWTYETQNAIAATTTTNIVTATNRDTAITGKTYHVFTNSNGSVNDYYNITGNDYYTFRNISAIPGLSPIQTIYLKDNAAAGISWSETVNFPIPGLPTAVPVVFTNIIAEKDISKTVNSISYSNVIHITTTLAVTGLPTGSVISDIQSYYAPKVGLIESKYKISSSLLTINIDQNTTLKNSDIK